MDRTFRWVLLGAKSGVGQSLLRATTAAGYSPVVGASDTRALRLAERYRLPFRALDLGDEEKISRQLLGIDLVLNAGGTDLQTLGRLGRACLKQGCGLIDLSDQVPEHLSLLRHAEMVESRGIPWIVSGGVASVTANLLSAHLHDLLPDAESLSLSTEGPDPRLSGIDLRWWRTGQDAPTGWHVRRGQLVDRPESEASMRDGLHAYPWRADLADARHGRQGLDVDAWVKLPSHLRSARIRRALADRPAAAGRIEHCIHRFGPPGFRRLTATGLARGSQGVERKATLAIRDALEVQKRIVLGLLDRYQARRLPAGVHTPLEAMGPELARWIGLGNTEG